MRLFFALWPSDEVRLAMAHARLDVARRCGGRPPAPVTMHLTLAFVGDTDDSNLPDLMRIGGAIKAKPFMLKIDTAHCFAKAQIAWIGSLAPPPAMFDLQEKLKTKLADAGFFIDPRAFRPHVTVSRHITGEFAPFHIPPIDWPVEAFQLVRSRLGQQGASYETLATFPLSGKK